LETSSYYQKLVTHPIVTFISRYLPDWGEALTSVLSPVSWVLLLDLLKPPWS